MDEIQEKEYAEGLKPTKYILGDKTTDGHTHVFYLRTELPIATTTDDWEATYPHAHSIEEGPDFTVICVEEAGHTHTKLVIEEAGDYLPRTLHI